MSPAREMPITVALWRFARGVADVANGRLADADNELRMFADVVKTIPAAASFGLNPAQSALSSSEIGPEEKFLQKELRECINRVFRKLEREQAEVLVMHDLDDLSYDEISRILGAGLSAVKMRIHRARLAFQQVFLQFCGKAQLTFSVTTQQHIPSQQKKGERYEL